MLFFALSFLCGILLFSLKNSPLIQGLELTLFFATISLFLAAIYRQLVIAPFLGFLLLGFTWMGLFSHWVLSNKVDPNYLNRAVLVSGKITSLVEESPNRFRFVFKSQTPFKANLRLSWYEKNPPVSLTPGATYQLLLKLKPNHGYQNPGGFDFEQYLFANRIDATGYVKPSNNNQLLPNDHDLSLIAIRHQIKEKFKPYLSQLEFGGVMNALILGDRSLIKEQHWQAFIDTGTTHLSVVSGLHIGLISGLLFYLSGFIWQRCSRCLLLMPKSVFGAYFGLLAALLYALIAGLSTPTQRALIMAGVVFISLIARRHHDIWQLYGLALFLVLLFNPLNVFMPGFWLSFYVVSIIIYTSLKTKDRHYLIQLVYIQIAISLATVPLIVYLFGHIAWSTPLANLLAVPLFSLILMPLVLLGALLSLLSMETLASLSFMLSNEILSALYQYLNYLQLSIPTSTYYNNSFLWFILLTALIILMLLLPKSLKLLSIGLISIVLLFDRSPNRPDPGQAHATVLDVGQGLAIVVQTHAHTLLFDTGAKYPSGFSLGEAVITPYLHQKKVEELDMVVISHGDNDHLGGLKAVQDNFPIQILLSSEPSRIASAEHCLEKRRWVWDGVVFEMLNDASQLSGNNASCVLKISGEKYSVLLTGDIEKKAEHYLISTLGNKLQSDVLVVPHHGSKTSSSDSFLQHVKPSMAVVSSGLNNRFNHPAKMVVARYQSLGIPMINTACAGGIEIHLGDTLALEKYRQTHSRYYWHQC